MAELIISIALTIGVPPKFALAIALTENPRLQYDAVNYNENGTNDVGIMQLNSAYFSHIDRYNAELNITEGILHIKNIMSMVDTWWQVAIVYNAGITRLYNPPNSTLDYAAKVMYKYTELSGGYVCPLIKQR